MEQEFDRSDVTGLLKSHHKLIEKITDQVYSHLYENQKLVMERADVRQCAVEGFLMAINKYDPEHSNMSFLSYAAFSMRNNCLTYVNEESRTIKVPFYGQKQMKEKGIGTVMTSRLNNVSWDKEDRDYDPILNLGYIDHRIEGHPVNHLIDFIKEHFSKDMVDIFCSFYGIGGYKEKTGLELAKEYGISNVTISSKIHKIIDYIRKDKNMMEILSDLL